MIIKLNSIFSKIYFLLIPFLLIILSFIYLINEQLYMHLTNEDGLLEWTTFFSLFLAGVLSFVISIRLKRSKSPYFWFFILFSVFCFFSSMEEISWGQRIMDINTPQFFVENSTQPETNIHNVMQKWGRGIPFFGLSYNFKTKHLAGIVLFLYGAFLPLAARSRKMSEFLRRKSIVVPPGILSLSFVIAALMMIDKPTGREEELGECFFSIAILLFIYTEFLKQKTT